VTDVPFWFFLFALWGFGLLFGSFANVVIWRFPRGESLSTPGSHCPQCDVPIAWYDNVPLLSWMVLRARCRHCGARISPRYPLVEAASGALWLLSGVVFGMTVRTGFAVIFSYVLLILTFIDIDHRRLPNKLVGALGVVGVLGVAAGALLGTPALPLVGLSRDGVLSTAPVSAALGVLLGGGLSLAIAGLYRVARGRTGLGMGDVKLLGVMGLYLGPYVLMALMLGSILGASWGILATPRQDGISATHIPFGPFLAAGAVVTAAVGPALWNAYAHAVGIG